MTKTGTGNKSIAKGVKSATGSIGRGVSVASKGGVSKQAISGVSKIGAGAKTSVGGIGKGSSVGVKTGIKAIKAGGAKAAPTLKASSNLVKSPRSESIKEMLKAGVTPGNAAYMQAMKEGKDVSNWNKSSINIVRAGIATGTVGGKNPSQTVKEWEVK